MQPWFLEYPRRLEEELQALRDVGYSSELDETAKSAGRIVIRVKYPLDGVMHDMMVLFPEMYPYVPFEIFCPSFPSGRHKNPNGGQLCLLKNPFQSWHSDDRLATFLTSQVPQIVEAHKRPQGAEDIEAHEAAQVTGYYSYVADTSVFTGDWRIPQEYQRGYLLLGLSQHGTRAPAAPLRAAVLEVQDEKHQVLAKIDDRLRDRYDTTAKGRWVRLASNPPFEPGSALAEGTKLWKDIATPRFDGAPDVVGLLIPEEIQYKQFGENWLFVVRQKIRGEKRETKMATYFARADQISESALLSRMSNLSPLREKKILIVGLGSIGSMYAYQMARAGIGAIHMIDYDHLQFGNGSRWLLAWPASGHDKSNLLAHHLRYQYPLTEFRAWRHRIGMPRTEHHEQTEAEILHEAMDGVDMIVDATAEWCISHLLSDLAKQRDIPYLWATGTPGAQGGTVGRVVPGKTTGCWKCYQQHLNDGNIIIPNHADLPEVQPVGCFHATFTGTGFDMDHVTLAAVRLSASTLCRGHDSGYPDFEWDVGVVNTWSTASLPIAPEWSTYSLDRHPQCDHE